MDDTKKIRWGVLSTANIGRAAVIPAIQASNNGAMVAVASRSGPKAQEFANKLNIPQAFDSYEALLAAKDIEAVYIPLPNSLHMEWTIKAAEAGKHILCEKPLALDAEECDRMEAAARANGVKLMEAFMYRFHPRTEQVLRMVGAGELGDLRLIHAAFTFRLTRPDNIRLQPELGGGALMDVGCYCVNICRTVAGVEPLEVQAFANWSPGGVDEQLVGTLRFTNGLIAQFDCALSLERREEITLAGTHAFLHVPAAFLPGTESAPIRVVHGRQGETVQTIPGTDEYQRMVEHFGECILTDQPVRYPAAEAAANMRVIQALYRSAREQGRLVAVSPIA